MVQLAFRPFLQLWDFLAFTKKKKTNKKITSPPSSDNTQAGKPLYFQSLVYLNLSDMNANTYPDNLDSGRKLKQRNAILSGKKERCLHFITFSLLHLRKTGRPPAVEHDKFRRKMDGRTDNCRTRTIKTLGYDTKWVLTCAYHALITVHTSSYSARRSLGIFSSEQ